MRKIKAITLLLAAILMIATLAACANTYNDLPNVSPSPSITPYTNPTISPLISPGLFPSPSPAEPAAPTLSGQESAELADKCDARVEAISEISTCDVVIVGSEAVAVVSFDPIYRGSLTERLINSVSSAVEETSNAISSTFVTAKQDARDKVNIIRDKQRKGASAEEIKHDFEELKNAVKVP